MRNRCQLHFLWIGHLHKSWLNLCNHFPLKTTFRLDSGEFWGEALYFCETYMLNSTQLSPVLVMRWSKKVSWFIKRSKGVSSMKQICRRSCTASHLDSCNVSSERWVSVCLCSANIHHLSKESAAITAMHCQVLNGARPFYHLKICSLND